MEGDARIRWAAILAPSIGLLILGGLFLPQYFMAFLGGAIGWIVAGALIFRDTKTPMKYREAVKAFRKNEYEKAVKALDELIRVEKNQPQHYRFRAEILRIWGKIPRARQDYETMLKYAQDDGMRAVAYNGLAEVDLQDKRYSAALKAAHQAYELAPQEWVVAYNLGMIQDRVGDAQATITSLEAALRLKIPDARHRLLTHFYLARAHSRLHNLPAAEQAVRELKKQQGGLREWELILKSDQAQVLREVLGADIEQARQLVNQIITPAQLAQSQTS
jgi:predicted Zn-dependent protease